ncbi:YceI family protein [Thermorudis peleae]|uniref:YceI family protein n=1 Tax=Thermorudis peleae TaxID=1382356 RepID=UPI00068A3FB2|nr:YceI family protein [Thermorudis peleae]
MTRIRLIALPLLVSLALALVLAACGGTATPTPTPAASSASTATPTATATSGTATGGTATSSAATSTATSGAATSGAATSDTATSSTATSGSTAGRVVLVVNPSQSQVSYTAHEQLVGHTLPNDAVGKTSAVSGQIVLDATGQPVASASKITVDLTTLRSDESRRDNYIKQNTLETSKYPQATFVPKSITGLSWPLPTSGQAQFQLTGDLTVHGVTKTVTWQVTATFNQNTVQGTATTQVTFEDFGMQPPKVPVVLSVEDNLVLTANLQLTVQTSS